jgi:hypothetical protein
MKGSPCSCRDIFLYIALENYASSIRAYSPSKETYRTNENIGNGSSWTAAALADATCVRKTNVGVRNVNEWTLKPDSGRRFRHLWVHAHRRRETRLCGRITSGVRLCSHDVSGVVRLERRAEDTDGFEVQHEGQVAHNRSTWSAQNNDVFPGK